MGGMMVPKAGAEAERDGISQRDAEVADGEAEGEAADSPENAPEDGVVDAGGILCVRGAKHARQVRHEDGGQQLWGR